MDPNMLDGFKYVFVFAAIGVLAVVVVVVDALMWLGVI